MGQAGFTIVLLILFNFVQPTGWTGGWSASRTSRSDVAVSLAVGVLFWPRGVGDLLRVLGAAYARSADYVASATRRLVAAGAAGSMEYATQPAREIARGAANRLDDAFREYLAESPLSEPTWSPWRRWSQAPRGCAWRHTRCRRSPPRPPADRASTSAPTPGR